MTITDNLTTWTTSAPCAPCQARQQHSSAGGTLSPSAGPITPATGGSPAGARWAGVIGVEGQVTGDGRIIEPNALRWEVPIPLRYVQADQGAHDGAEVVGQIDSISRGPGGQILGAGTFDTGGPTGIEAMRQVSEGLTTGISMEE